MIHYETYSFITITLTAPAVLLWQCVSEADFLCCSVTLLHVFSVQDPCVLPHSVYTSHVLDTISVTTEVDHLYKERESSFLSKNSPIKDVADSSKVMIERYLTDCNHWERTGESLSDTSDPLTHEHDNSMENEQTEERARFDTANYVDMNLLPRDSPMQTSDSHDYMIEQYITFDEADTIEVPGSITVECVSQHKNDSGQTYTVIDTQPPVA